MFTEIFTIEKNPTLQWHHIESSGVSNHRCLQCLLNCCFRHRWKKTSKLCVTGLCAGNSPQKRLVTWKMFPFDDIMWNLGILYTSCRANAMAGATSWHTFWHLATAVSQIFAQQCEHPQPTLSRRNLKPCSKLQSEFIWECPEVTYCTL